MLITILINKACSTVKEDFKVFTYNKKKLFFGNKSSFYSNMRLVCIFFYLKHNNVRHIAIVFLSVTKKVIKKYNYYNIRK